MRVFVIIYFFSQDVDDENDICHPEVDWISKVRLG